MTKKQKIEIFKYASQGQIVGYGCMVFDGSGLIQVIPPALGITYFVTEQEALAAGKEYLMEFNLDKS